MTTQTAAINSPFALSSRTASRIQSAARLLFGLLFLVSGLSGIAMVLGLLQAPAPAAGATPDATALFMAALLQTGYLVPLIKGTETLVGALLISNRYVPLALALIAPIVVNIVALGLFLNPSGLGLSLVLLAFELFLAWSYRRAYAPMLAARHAT